LASRGGPSSTMFVPTDKTSTNNDKEKYVLYIGDYISMAEMTPPILYRRQYLTKVLAS